MTIQKIEPMEVHATGGRIALLDIRDLGEFEEAHIGGATALPRQRFESDLEVVVPDMKAEVVLYGADDERVELAAQTAEELGYTNVRVMRRGIAGWQQGGGVIHSGTNVPSKVFGEHLLHEDSVPEVTAAELSRELEDGDAAPLVLDVRTAAEFLRGCIPGAINLPGGDLVGAATALRLAGRPIVTHCAGRTRSLVAAATLRKLGLKDVRALRNGTMGWLLDGKELEAPSMSRTFSWKPGAAPTAAIFQGKRIAVADFQARLESGVRDFYLFDVRSSAEYEAGHLPGAVNVPGGQLVQCADDHIALRDAGIFLVSEHGERAAATGWWLTRMKYENVFSLGGGLDAWRRAGFEVEFGPRLRQSVPAHAPFIEAVGLYGTLKGASPPVILDLGSSIRYAKRHVPGAHWISRGWLEIEVPKRLLKKDTSVVLTGTSLDQAQMAAKSLSELGYSQVKVLRQSIEILRSLGLPLESGMTSHWSKIKDLANLAILKRDRAGMQRYLDWELALAGGREV